MNNKGVIRAASCPAIFAALARLGVPDVWVSKRAGVAPAFLSQARRGQKDGPGSRGSWARIVAGIRALGGEVPPAALLEAGISEADVPALAADPKAPAPPIPTSGAPLASPSSAALGPAAELEALNGAIDTLGPASSFVEVDAVVNRVIRLIGRGLLPRSQADSLLLALREKRQVVGELVEERARVDSRKAVVVDVVWTSDWRRKAEANRAAEAATRTPSS